MNFAGYFNWRSRSKGKEPYVLKVDEPQNLYGIHADLMTRTLEQGEKILYLIYSPIWEAEETPASIKFISRKWKEEGIKAVLADKASHALAVTEGSFIISKDYHHKSVAPSVQRIPFEQVLAVSLGSTLLLGWLTIAYINNGHFATVNLNYHTTTGRDHFHKAIRVYRERIKPIPKDCLLTRRTWAEVWTNLSLAEMESLSLLKTDEEFALFFFRSSETWTTRKRWFRKMLLCVKPKSLFLVTNLGIFYIIEEPPIKPGMLSFGSEISSLPLEVIASASLEEEANADKISPILNLRFGRNSIFSDWEVPFNQADIICARDFLQWLIAYKFNKNFKL